MKICIIQENKKTKEINLTKEQITPVALMSIGLFFPFFHSHKAIIAFKFL